MSGKWPMVRLGEILTKSGEWADLEPEATYREVTVRLWGKGVVRRREATGAELGVGRRHVVRAGQFILSRIDARNGAVGIVPAELDGAVVSNDFPSFAPCESRVLPGFLGWLGRTRGFVAICQAASEGTTNRVRLQEDRFLATPIALPPLGEQRRIVTRIEELAAKVEEARELRREAGDEAMAMDGSAWRRVLKSYRSSDWRCLTVEECCEAIIDYRGRTPPTAEAGIPHLTSANIKGGRIDWNVGKWVSTETYRAYMTRGLPAPGDVIFTMEAPLGEAAVVLDERPFSLAQRLLLLRPAKGLVEGEFLAKVLMSPFVRSEIYASATGTTVKGVAAKRLRGIPLPIPPITGQRRICGYLCGLQGKAEALRRLQAETAREIDALLPAILDRAFRGEL